MMNCLVIGGGFSARLAMQALSEFNPLQLVAEFDHDGSAFASIPGVFDQRHLRKFREYHQRGGNSNVWGGFIDLSSLKTSDLDLLNAIGALPVRFNWMTNGYRSNANNLAQLRESDGRIYTAFPTSNSITGEAVRLSKKKDHIEVIAQARRGSTPEVLKVKSLVLAAGVFNTINLLVRSDLFENAVQMTLDECNFNMGLRFSERSLLQAPSEIGTRIQFALDRVFAHGFKKHIANRRFTFLPSQIAVEQHFGNEIDTASWNLEFDKETGCWAVEASHSSAFGRSVHYCNLHINDKPVTQFLEEYANIKIIGMAAVRQEIGGPISQELVKVASDWVA